MIHTFNVITKMITSCSKHLATDKNTPQDNNSPACEGFENMFDVIRTDES